MEMNFRNLCPMCLTFRFRDQFIYVYDILSDLFHKPEPGNDPLNITHGCVMVMMAITVVMGMFVAVYVIMGARLMPVPVVLRMLVVVCVIMGARLMPVPVVLRMLVVVCFCVVMIFYVVMMMLTAVSFCMIVMPFVYIL